MQEQHWHNALISLILLGAVSFPAMAQDAELEAAQVNVVTTHPRHFQRSGTGFRPAGNGFAAKLEHSLGLTPEQRDTVRGLLSHQHEQLTALRQESAPKYQAIQEQTDAKIRALLSAEQQKKFDALVTEQKAARAARHTHRGS